MNVGNLYERMSIHQLTTLIGELNLESIAGILRVLQLPSFDPDAVYTRSFLAGYANKTIGPKLLGTSAGFIDALNLLTLEEIQELYQNVIEHSDLGDRNAMCLKIAVAFRGKSTKSIICDLLGFEVADAETIGADTEVLSCNELAAAEKPYMQLKDYQFEVYFQALDRIFHPYSRFILQMPTGSGKTRTAMELVCEFLNSTEDSSVVWLAHSTELCDQASQCFLDLWPHLGKRNVKLQRLYGGHQVSGSKEKVADFLCASFQSMYLSVKDYSSNFSDMLHGNKLIVVDEAHRAVAPTYKKVIQALTGSGGVVMGLTATPGRTYRNTKSDLENTELADFFFNTIISFNPHEKTAIKYLRDKNVLSKATFEPLAVSARLSLTQIELSNAADIFDLPPSFLKRLGKDSIRNSEIIHKIMQLITVRSLKSIIYFATSVEQSILINSLLRFLGFESEHVDGTTNKEVRSKIIANFRNQKVQVLCNYEVLSTGFDAPKVDCVFIARPTASVVLYSQMIGRGLRGVAIGGTSNCLIVNVIDNIQQLPAVDEMFNLFEEYWSTEKVN